MLVVLDRQHSGKPHRIGDVLNIFARAAHAPEMTMRVNASMFAFIPPFVRSAISALGPVKTIKKQKIHE